MTFEGKLLTIHEFCRRRNERVYADCEGCPLRHLCYPIHGLFRNHEDKTNEAYMVLVELGLIPAEDAEKAPDNVNHPAHYETGKYECIDVMVEALGADVVKGFCLGNAFKYLYRCKHKHQSPTEDIKKALWYLNKFVELEG